MKKLKLNFKPLIKKFEMFTKKNTISELSGSYLSLLKGKGMDFEGYRVYSESDDARDIDWKASLRSPNMLVRILTEERNVKVFFLFDVSDSMLCSSIDKLKCEYAAEIIASLSFAILRAGDSVGLAMFSDKVVKNLPPKNGSKHYYDIISTLSSPNLYGGKFNLSNVLKFLNSCLQRNSVVIIISDFIGLDDSWKRHLKIASKKFNFLLTLIIRDPIDNKFPNDPGQVVLEDPFLQNKMLIDPARVSKSYESKSKDIKEKVRLELSKVRCATLELITDKPFEKPLINFLIKSKEKWR